MLGLMGGFGRGEGRRGGGGEDEWEDVQYVLISWIALMAEAMILRWCDVSLSRNTVISRVTV